MTNQPPPSGPILLGPQTNISGDVNTGGGLFNSGTLHQYNFPAAGTPARDPVPLAVALARLAALPADQVPPVAALPAGSWLPLPANPYFVGRQPELLALARALKGGHTAGIVPGHTAAATGLGGIGKTQLAAAFAHHYGQYFLGGVYWLSFADPAAISAEVAQCAAWMSDLPTGVTHLPIPDQLQMVRRAWHEPLPRLLIFDNCEDPALLAAWRPTHGGCHIIVTSRRARWSGSQNVTPIPVGILPRAESIALLAKFAPSPNLGEGWGGGVLDAIAAELGDLPLALHMAGSYLAHVAYDLPPSAYLAALRRPGLLDHLSLTAADYSPTSHELHVARTFALSYTRLDDTNATDATARHLLACAACFAGGEAIPRVLLRAAADQWQPPPPPTALSLTDTWAALHEGLDRFANLAGHYSSRALLAFTRQPLNTAVTHFIGDVFVYLAARGAAQNPGPIIQTITAQLDQAAAARHPTRDPYLIVIAHSMGGNITYDLLTHFRPGAYPVDLLITVGSQVALMEELYKASDQAIPIDPRQQRVPKPPGVKHWLNVYDPNDVLSYAAEGVFEGVNDFVYTTGKHVIAAHTAYFQRGSFYRRLAVRVKELLQP